MSGNGWRRVACVAEIEPGCSQEFHLGCGGEELEGFVVNNRGSFFAYLNRCTHLPVPLDWFENRFFAEDGHSLTCSTHGSLFRPDTGECVAGLGFGASFLQLPLKIQDGEVFVACPEGGSSETPWCRH